MHRFFVSADCIDGERVVLAGDLAYQLTSVLRASPGKQIIVLDDFGWEYLVTLDRISPRDVRGRVMERSLSKGEPTIRVTLYLALLKASKFELVLQKGTELGVSRFVPIFCSRSVPKDRGAERASSRYRRWRQIISEAAEQSRRGRLPVLEPAANFDAACDTARGLVMIPWEEESETGLKAALARYRECGYPDAPVSIFTGPEGGFTRPEVDYARAKGIVPVSLGRRILRAETAPIATLAAILYEMGEFGV